MSVVSASASGKVSASVKAPLANVSASASAKAGVKPTPKTNMPARTNNVASANYNGSNPYSLDSVNISGVSASGKASVVSETSQQASYEMAWPSAHKEKVVTSDFGWRSSPCFGASSNHKGVDIRARYGEGIQAAQSGTVVKSYGSTIEIEHENGVVTRYYHLSGRDVKRGQRVEAGQNIGSAGNTGPGTGAHLHFETLVNGKQVDPMIFLYQHDAKFKNYSERKNYNNQLASYAEQRSGFEKNGVKKFEQTDPVDNKRIAARASNQASVHTPRIIEASNSCSNSVDFSDNCTSCSCSAVGCNGNEIYNLPSSIRTANNSVDLNPENRNKGLSPENIFDYDYDFNSERLPGNIISNISTVSYSRDIDGLFRDAKRILMQMLKIDDAGRAAWLENIRKRKISVISK